MTTNQTRLAYVGGDPERVARFLPSNYHVVEPSAAGFVIIAGEDVAGWTLDDYVLPRLASGAIYGNEIFAVDCGTCPLCGGPSVVVVEDAETAAAVRAWMADDWRPYVQDAFPQMSAGMREQILNGSHEACFDAAFAEDESEDRHIDSPNFPADKEW